MTKAIPPRARGGPALPGACRPPARDRSPLADARGDDFTADALSARFHGPLGVSDDGLETVFPRGTVRMHGDPRFDADGEG